MEEQSEVVEAPTMRSLVVRGVVTTALIVAAVAIVAVGARGPAEDLADWIVAHLGVWGIFVAVLLADALTFPVPPDTYLLAAVASHADEMQILAAIAVSGLAFQAEAYPENCKTTDDREIASLFDGWNAALATGKPTDCK